ncbi:hypothetical protein MCUN1_002896 [Malassezia cuniculi]|uniref:Homeobox domain-containing protein n=1 Tax=Malassezia cuniculi TaxID=948313 RepID=A0AAF0ESN3_9BASI|nr:hypothetical protein MCUN1_002896 [Malassezia cuniculi]
MSAKSMSRNLVADQPRGLVTREKKRRRRTRPHEADILMAAYLQNPFPNDKARAQIAAAVGMQPRAVSIWFQNRRQAEKKRSARYCVASQGGKRDLQSLVPSNSILRPCPMNRSVSAPDVLLETSIGSNAELGRLMPGLTSTTEGRGIISGIDRDLWERMESSSVPNSSDMDDHSSDIDDEERTLRRLAFRRSQQADARSEIKRTGMRRVQSAQKMRSAQQLELATARGGADKENMPPEDAPLGVRTGKMMRTESMPIKSALANTHAAARATLGRPEPYSGMRRAISGGAIDLRTRESSARSDIKPIERPEAHDDSGFFDEGDVSDTSPMRASVHDRHAAELLLGLGTVHTHS